ncbi:MAG: hypothetical protein AVDCRST_MAG64-2839, partial [uncultured Phycisphaerae bacterium]
EQPGDGRPRHPAAPAGPGAGHEEGRPAAEHGRPRPPARGPDQRLRLLRGHALPRPQEGGRDRREDLLGGGLAGGALLHRRRARGARARRGRHAPERPARPRARRDLRGGRPALRRGDPLGPDHRHRPDQLLEPPHRHREAAGGLVPGL